MNDDGRGYSILSLGFIPLVHKKYQPIWSKNILSPSVATCIFSLKPSDKRTYVKYCMPVCLLMLKV